MKCKDCNSEMENHDILGCYECDECGHIEITKEIKYEYISEECDDNE
jgi:predicted RNA-binding Zn-ribbon protein involved in translation (DUF1610 family)